MKPSLKVDPILVNQFAIGFGNLVAAFGSLSSASDDIGDTGDSRLTHAIEQFLARSSGGIKELSSQFGQLQRVLAATVQGYDAMEKHIASNIEANL